MVRNHARKAAARGRRREHPAESHRQAVDQIRNDDGVPDELVVVSVFPSPDLEGDEPCDTCDGTGVTGERCEVPEEFPEPGAPVAKILDELCPECRGSGLYYYWVYSQQPGRAGRSKKRRCSWCNGFRYTVLEGMSGPRTPEEHQAYDRLRQWAIEAGVDLSRLDEPILYGDFDRLMGPGATDLAWSTTARQYLRVPCRRCAGELCRTVRRSELIVR